MNHATTRVTRPRGPQKPILVLLLALVAVLAVVAAGCGGDSEEAAAPPPAEQPAEPAEQPAEPAEQPAEPAEAPAEATPSACSDYQIPESEVRLGLGPFGDNSIPVIGINNGWYEEVGIRITPEPLGQVTLNEEVVPQILNDEIDIATQWTPSQLQLMVRAPEIKMIGFFDTYIGLYILASPTSDAQTLADFMAEGMSFDEAINATMAQMDGKKLGVDNTGAHQVFLNTLQEIGGFSYSDDLAELITIDDAKLVQLGRGGEIEFAKPGGGPQNVQLIQDGWYPMISIQEIIENLPPGDPRGVGAIGHTGPAANVSFWEEDRDTLLRWASVYFRIADAWKADPEATLAQEVDYLESVSGAEIGLDGLVQVFANLNPLVTFEEQAAYWVDESDPFHYTNVYSFQIAELQEGGVLPEGEELDPSDVIIGDEIYAELLALKEQYDALLPEASGLTGDCTALAEQAQTQYDNRNYLDAARMLEVAVAGKES